MPAIVASLRPARLPAPESVSTEPDPAAMDRFLRTVQARALRIAQFELRDADAAADAVQDAMVRLCRRYARRPADEWPALFHRILQNRLRDQHRREKVRRFPRLDAEPDEREAAPELRDADGHQPEARQQAAEALARLETALRALAPRQRQAFLLRYWEQLDTARTAQAMGVSEGSVKTHLHRALQQLRAQLGDTWP